MTILAQTYFCRQKRFFPPSDKNLPTLHERSAIAIYPTFVCFSVENVRKSFRMRHSSGSTCVVRTPAQLRRNRSCVPSVVRCSRGWDTSVVTPDCTPATSRSCVTDARVSLPAPITSVVTSRPIMPTTRLSIREIRISQTFRHSSNRSWT